MNVAMGERGGRSALELVAELGIDRLVPTGRFTHRDDGHQRVADDALGDAAGQEVRDAAAPARAHDDDAGLLVLGHLQDGRAGDTVSDLGPPVGLRREVLEALELQVRDTKLAWSLRPDDVWERVMPAEGEEPLNSQRELMRHARMIEGGKRI